MHGHRPHAKWHSGHTVVVYGTNASNIHTSLYTTLTTIGHDTALIHRNQTAQTIGAQCQMHSMAHCKKEAMNNWSCYQFSVSTTEQGHTYTILISIWHGIPAVQQDTIGWKMDDLMQIYGEGSNR